jgi:hypothetical protein
VENKQIPVFYHIPKSAGTYIRKNFLSLLRILFSNNDPYRTDGLFNKVKEIYLRYDRKYIGNFIVLDPMYFIDDSGICEKEWISSNKKRAKAMNTFDYFIDLENKDSLDKLLEVCQILSINIFSAGFRVHEKILNSILNKNNNPFKFLILRDPFDRACSLFEYLNDEASSHEITHKIFENLVFEEYVLSNQMSDSWLIKNLLDKNDSNELTEKDLNEIINLLSSQFNVYHIDKVDDAICDVLNKCFNFNANNIKSILFNKNLTKINATKKLKIKIDSLPENIQSAFLERARYDQILYKHFFKK